MTQFNETSGVTEDPATVKARAIAFGRDACGPALDAYRRWLRDEAGVHDIAVTLFLGPGCGRLRLLTGRRPDPREIWLPDADPVLGLAEMDHASVDQCMLALATANSGLTAPQFFARFDVPAPAHAVLEDLGLTDATPLGFGQEELTRRFINAFRWDFFKVARRLRASLFRQLAASGLRPGQKIGIVDIASDGRLVDVASHVLSGILDVEMRGHAFLLDAEAQARACEARIPVTAFATTLDLAPPVLATARARADLFDAALRSGSGSAEDAGIAEGVASYAAQESRAASVSALFERLCAETPELSGLPETSARGTPPSRSAA